MLRTALEAISGGYILENHQDSEGERTLLQFSQQVPGKVKNKSYCLKKIKKIGTCYLRKFLYSRNCLM